MFKGDRSDMTVIDEPVISPDAVRSHMRPWGNRVAVKRIEQKTSKGGIALPDTVDDDPDKIHYGEVFAVGEGQYTQEGKLLPIDLKPGDTIAYMLDFEVEQGGQKFWIVDDQHILARFRK